MNSVNITGKLVFDTELKKTNSGKSVVNFVVDVKTENGKPSDFIDCIAWDDMAEKVAKHGLKGTLIEISGHIINDGYVDRNMIKRKVQKVMVDSIQRLGSEV